MRCGHEIAEYLVPVFKTDFGITVWCQYLPWANKETTIQDMEFLISPIFLLSLHVFLFICSFIVGYSVNPILDTSRFDLIKADFGSREEVLREQIMHGEGEKNDIKTQLTKLSSVDSRYKKEFPLLKSTVDNLDKQVTLLQSHLKELRDEKLEIDRKSFQVISDFASMQQSVIPAENITTNRQLRERMQRLENLIEMHTQAARKKKRAKKQAKEVKAQGDAILA